MFDMDLHNPLKPRLGNINNAPVLDMFSEQHTEPQRCQGALLGLPRQIDERQRCAGREEQMILPRFCL